MGFCTRTGRAEIPIPPPETKGRKKVVSCEQTLQSLVFSHTHIANRTGSASSCGHHFVPLDEVALTAPTDESHFGI